MSSKARCRSYVISSLESGLVTQARMRWVGQADEQFAPSSSSDISHPPSPDPFNAGKSTVFNGYHLLNEVSTGGTLSSLFSILNLFVEDVKISWTPPTDGIPDTGAHDPDETFSQSNRPKKSRQNSDVSQLDEGTMNSLRSVDLTDVVDSPTTPVNGNPGMQRKRSSSLGTATARADSPTAHEPASPKAAEAEDVDSPSSTSPVSTRPGIRSSASNRSSPSFTSPLRVHNRFTPTFAPLSQPHSRQHSQRPPKRQATGTAALKGAIARATTDTTLAVIPAEAFRKLTRKFPKASGTVVQVVLERFSRVTFMTGRSPSTYLRIKLTVQRTSFSVLQKRFYDQNRPSTRWCHIPSHGTFTLAAACKRSENASTLPFADSAPPNLLRAEAMTRARVPSNHATTSTMSRRVLPSKHRRSRPSRQRTQ